MLTSHMSKLPLVGLPNISFGLGSRRRYRDSLMTKYEDPISGALVLTGGPRFEGALHAWSSRTSARRLTQMSRWIPRLPGRFEDLDSKNGTYLWGERLTTPAALTDGDEVRIGSVTVRFRRLESEWRQQSAGRNEGPRPPVPRQRGDGINLAEASVRITLGVPDLKA